MTPEVKKIQGEKLHRSFELDRAKIDQDARTVELSFSSEEPFKRWFGYEVLDHKKGSMRMNRLKGRAAFLLEHDTSKQIGVVEKAWIEDKRGKAIVRFSKSPLGEEIFKDVTDGIRSLVSVGYQVHKLVREKEEDDVATYRVNDWEPFELSLVAVPADATVGVGRTAEDEPQVVNEQHADAEAPTGDGIKSGDAGAVENRDGTAADAEADAQSPSIEVSQTRNMSTEAKTEDLAQTRKIERERINEIRSIGKRHNCDQLADTAIESGMDVAEFKSQVLEKLGKNIKPLTPAEANPMIGMSDQEVKRFSIVRAINRLASGKALDGLEGEVTVEMEKKSRRSIEGSGFYIPEDVMVAKRDLSAGTGSGANVVQTDVLTDSMIEVLRNKMLVVSLGARQLNGLVGDVAIPKAGAATVYWLTETESVSESSQTITQVALTPKRLAAMTAYSRQLLAQTGLSIESFVREDLMAGLAVAQDLAALAGTGAAGQPLGILGTGSGVGTVTFGAAATRAKCLEFESAVDVANALNGSLHWVTSPGTKAKWRAKDATANAGKWLWADDGNVIGYSANATNQLTSTNKVIFGDWSQIVLGSWAGVSVIVDQFSLSPKNQIRLVVNMLCDVALRHPTAFAVSTDSGAQ